MLIMIEVNNINFYNNFFELERKEEAFSDYMKLNKITVLLILCLLGIFYII